MFIKCHYYASDQAVYIRPYNISRMIRNELGREHYTEIIFEGGQDRIAVRETPVAISLAANAAHQQIDDLPEYDASRYESK